MTGNSIGQAEFALRFPLSLLSRRLEGRLNTPHHDPACEVPADNSSTVTVEATVDAQGKHRLVRARGERVDAGALQSLAALVCDFWHSGSPRSPDGTKVDLLEGETISLTVAFPILAAASR